MGGEILVLPALLYNRVLCRNVFLTHILCLALPEGGFLAILLFWKNKMCILYCVFLGGLCYRPRRQASSSLTKEEFSSACQKKGKETADAHAGSFLKMGWLGVLRRTKIFTGGRCHRRRRFYRNHFCRRRLVFLGRGGKWRQWRPLTQHLDG